MTGQRERTRKLLRGEGQNPLRSRAAVRNLLHEPALSPADLVMPLLVRDPDVRPGWLPTFTVAELPGGARDLRSLGLKGVKIFAQARRKDRDATDAVRADSLMLRAVETVKDAVPELCVMVETCLCAYTDTGHCYLSRTDGAIDRERTFEALCRAAILQAGAGADVLGPAGMIDGSVRAVRQAADDGGYRDVAIMPHLIFDSSLYGGYRHAMRAAPASGSRSAFHIDPSQRPQAVAQARSFLDEGAEMLLLEPALPVVDALVELRSTFTCPIAAF